MKVAAVTATRAEFGLLAGLLKEIHESPRLELQLIVTGTHLLEEFGHTVQEIHSAGIPISRTVNEISHANTGLDVANQVGAGVMGFSKVFSELQPDMIVILGDRYEMLAASVAAFFLGIPILHIHGGEVTEGAFDDSIRHAITKLATIHCVAHEDYRRRVIQMGEHPDTVHVVGSLGAEGAETIVLKERGVLEKELGIAIRQTLLLVTFHPITAGDESSTRGAEELVAALHNFTDATVVFTIPNGDPGHTDVELVFRREVAKHPGSWHFFESLGQENYWSMMAEASAVVGNSSSGILEAPSFGVPTINIGNRQKGRIFAPSVINCDPKKLDIQAALETVLSTSFRSTVQQNSNPFSRPGTVESIISTIRSSQQGPAPGKSFFDIPLPQ